MTKFSLENPNCTKSLTNFYKRLLQRAGREALPSLDLRGTSSDFWELRVVLPEFGEFSTTAVPLNVAVLAGTSAESTSPHALRLAVMPIPGALIKISTGTIGGICSVPAGAAWTIVPPWHAQSGEILGILVFVLLAAVPFCGYQPERLKQAVKEKANNLGFMVSDTPKPSVKKQRSAYVDAGGAKYNSTTFLTMAAAAFASWTTTNRPNEVARIASLAAKRKAAFEKQGKYKRFCPNCACSSCAAAQQEPKK